MFETNLRDERFLPFEGAGAVNSTWRLQLPADFPPFDYTTISDAILHLRYTARQAGDPLGSTAVKELRALIAGTDTSNLALLFLLRNDFPTEWSAFVNSPSTAPTFNFRLQKSYFPYFVQGMKIGINSLLLYSPDLGPASPQPDSSNLQSVSNDLNGPNGHHDLSLAADSTALTTHASQTYLVIRYSARGP